MTELIPKFEQSSGYKVLSDLNGAIGAMTVRIKKGEAADVAIVSGAQIDVLVREGKVLAGSRVDLAKAGVGVFVRKGVPKPDVGLVETFKRTMLRRYQSYYNERRTHLSLGKDTPFLRMAQIRGHIVVNPVLGGLHHHYCRI
jgi:molybdate transport system substrate-binding protein